MNPNGTYHYVSLLPIFVGASTPLAQWQAELDADPWLKTQSARLATVLYSMYPAQYKGMQPPVQTARKVILQTLRQYKTSRDALAKSIDYLANRGPARGNQCHIAKVWDFAVKYMILTQERAYTELRNATERERQRHPATGTDPVATSRRLTEDLAKNMPLDWQPEYYVKAAAASYLLQQQYEALLTDLGHTRGPLPVNAPIGPVLASRLGNVWYYPPGHKYTPPPSNPPFITAAPAQEPPPEPPAEPPA